MDLRITCPDCGHIFNAGPPGEDGLLRCPVCRREFPPPAEPQRRFGKYDLLEEISRGGMGIIYKGRDPTTGRIVALKVLIAGEEASAEQVMRFYHEARACSKLRHPGIVPIHDVGIHLDRHYLAMDFIEGTTLERQLLDGPLDPRQAASLLTPIVRAVAYAHSRGIVHRDIKPSNILIDKRGVPYITDFGLAKEMASDVRLTRSGIAVGTPAYMSPEQAMGDLAAVDERSDVYGLGTLLYEATTGRPPFLGETPMATMLKVIHEEAPAPHVLRADFPRDLEIILQKAMQKNKVDRYPSAEALGDDIENFLSGRPIAARPVRMVSRLIRRVSRYKTAAIAVAGIVFVSAAVIAGLLVYTNALQKGKLQTEKESQRKDTAIEELKQKYQTKWTSPVFLDRFDRSALGDKWIVSRDKGWAIRDGRLRSDGAAERATAAFRPAPPITGNFRFAFKIALPEAAAAGAECGFLIFPDISKSAYRIRVGGAGKRVELFVNDRLAEWSATPAASGEHAVACERFNELITVTVDDGNVIRYSDVPESFPKGAQFGFYAKGISAAIGDVSLSAGGLPQKVDVVRLGDISFAERDFAAALKRYEEVRQLYPETLSAVEAAYKTGLCKKALAETDREKSRALLEEARSAYASIVGNREPDAAPFATEALFHLAALELENNRPDSAYRHFLALRTLAPDAFALRRPVPNAGAAGEALRMEGNLDGAVYFLSRSAENATPASSDAANLSLGLACFAEGAFAKAADIFETLAGAKPDRSADVRVRAALELGRARLAAGNADGAVAAWDAVRTDPSLAQAKENLRAAARVMTGLSPVTELSPGPWAYVDRASPEQTVPWRTPEPLDSKRLAGMRLADAWRLAFVLPAAEPSAIPFAAEWRGPGPEPVFRLTLSAEDGLRFYRGKEPVLALGNWKPPPDRDSRLEIERYGVFFALRLNDSEVRLAEPYSAADRDLAASFSATPESAVRVEFAVPALTRHEAMLNFASRLLVSRNAPGAANEFLRILSPSENPAPAVAARAALLLGFTLEQTRKIPEALARYETLATGNDAAPAYAATLRTLAILAAGAPPETLGEKIRAFIAKFPKHPLALDAAWQKNLLDLVTANRRKEAVLAANERFLRDFPGDAVLSPLLLMDDALLSFTLGRTEDAARLCRTLPEKWEKEKSLLHDANFYEALFDMTLNRPDDRRRATECLKLAREREAQMPDAFPAAALILEDNAVLLKKIRANAAPAPVVADFCLAVRAERTGNFPAAKNGYDAIAQNPDAPEVLRAFVKAALPRLAEPPTAVRNWYILGPFAADAASAADAPPPPETELDRNAEYKSGGQILRWRRQHTETPEVNLDALLSSSGNASAYAAAVVNSVSARDADLWVTTGGSFRLWVNRAQVETAGKSPARVNFRKGPNVILVKLARKAGDWNFALRVADPAGEPEQFEIRPPQEAFSKTIP